MPRIRTDTEGGPRGRFGGRFFRFKEDNSRTSIIFWVSPKRWKTDEKGAFGPEYVIYSRTSFSFKTCLPLRPCIRKASKNSQDLLITNFKEWGGLKKRFRPGTIQDQVSVPDWGFDPGYWGTPPILANVTGEGTTLSVSTIPTAAFARSGYRWASGWLGHFRDFGLIFEVNVNSQDDFHRNLPGKNCCNHLENCTFS